MPELRKFDDGIANGKLLRHKSPGISEIPAEVIKASRKQKKLKMFRRIFGPRRKDVSGSGENYIIMCLVNCIPHPINFG